MQLSFFEIHVPRLVTFDKTDANNYWCMVRCTGIQVSIFIYQCVNVQDKLLISLYLIIYLEDFFILLIIVIGNWKLILQFFMEGKY